MIYGIGIFDDHPLITSGLAAMLNSQPQYEVLFTAGEEAELLNQLAAQKPAAVILDIVAPGISGLDLFKTVRTNHPGIQIIAHSSLTSTVLVENLLLLGVKGYVNKRQPPETMLEALDVVLAGKVYVPDQYRFLVAKSKRTEDPIQLSAREKQILDLILEGLITKEIADRLSISKNTVENHRANIFKKFDVGNLAELIKQALRLGYITG